MEPQGCKRPCLPKIDLVKLVHFTKKVSEARRGNILLPVYTGMKSLPTHCPVCCAGPEAEAHGSCFSLQSAHPTSLVDPGLTQNATALCLSMHVIPHQSSCLSRLLFKADRCSGEVLCEAGHLPSSHSSWGTHVFTLPRRDNQNKKVIAWICISNQMFDNSLENWTYGENISLDTHRDNDKEIALCLFPEYAKHFLPSHLMYFFTKVFLVFFLVNCMPPSRKLNSLPF